MRTKGTHSVILLHKLAFEFEFERLALVNSTVCRSSNKYLRRLTYYRALAAHYLKRFLQIKSFKIFNLKMRNSYCDQTIYEIYSEL